MLIGVPKEIKINENRVGLVPGSVRELVQHGHQVLVQQNAGQGIGFHDDAYTAAGAKIAATAEEIFAKADMIVKVKEPQPSECAMLRDGQILFTYLHLAADKAQTEALIASKSVCIAYETVTNHRGGLPLLIPMSEVACGCRFRLRPIAWKNNKAVRVCCWAVCRVCNLPRSS